MGSSSAAPTALTASSPDAKSSPVGPLIYAFGPFRLDPANRQLIHRDVQTGEPAREVPLPGRAFDLLLVLVRHPGQLLIKEDLLATVWEGSFVEESNLTVAISTLRRALQEDPQDRRFIQTVARRGYRFIAEVEAEAAPAKPSPITKPSPIAKPSSSVQHNTVVEPLPTVAQPDVPETITASITAAAAAAEDAPPATIPTSQPPASELIPRTSFAHRWSLLALYGLLFIALGGCCWYLLKPRSVLHSLAVLPLTLANPSPGSPDEVQLLGMTDALATRLESQLAVRPTSSVLRYSSRAGDRPDPVAAGREQKVDAVLTGELTTSPTDAAATLRLRLIRVRDGIVLWQEAFRGASLPAIESDAGAAAARQLHHLGAAAAPSLRQAADPLAQARNPAWQLYLRGRYFWNLRTPDGLRKSVECFRQAIDADPNFAPAYAGLADSYALLASFSVEPGSTANADARSAALSAIQLDPTLAQPHASLGMILFFTDWNLAAAEREFERSISLDPNYATAHHWYSLDLAAMGRFPEALYEARLAQKLDPLSLIINTNVGWIEYLAHDNAAADHDLDRVLELDPTFARARTRLGMVELSTGKPDIAVREFTRAVAGSALPDPYVLGLLGDAQASAGDRPAAERTLAQLERIGQKTYVPPVSRALVLIGLGRREEAIAALSQAVDDHSTSLVYARVDPTLDSLRSDPAFQSLLSRTKL